jgi:predicted enzyme related to lactoylglutathione lyase
MATRRTPKKSSKKASGRTGRTAAKRAPAKKSAAKASSKKAAAPAARKIRPGFVSHTELASANPAATKEWAQKVLGWKFGDPMPTPMGPYHMWSFGENMGGGIRSNNPPEGPGSIPYCEVSDIKATYEKALKAGAVPMMPPDQIPGGAGWIAIVQAPGGVPIGFWGTK